MPVRTWRIGTWPWLPGNTAGPRQRVIVDNDFAGDPDDLYQLVHHLLSPSVDIRGIICSHLRPGDPFYAGSDSADEARRVVENVAAVMRLDLDGRVYTGSNLGLASRSEPRDTLAARFIIDEAMREEPDLGPLYVVCGGGLTEIASAYLMEPRIAERLTVVWIGGPEHQGLAYPPPAVEDPEYNLRIDLIAGQVVLNDSSLPLWLVPRNMYRQCLVSQVELRQRVANRGPVGRLLYDAIDELGRDVLAGPGLGETYALGDSPLVLLTALQSCFQPDTSSSDHVLVPCPELDDGGLFRDASAGRLVRVYTRLDVRLMFEDLFLKLDEFSAWLETSQDPTR